MQIYQMQILLKYIYISVHLYPFLNLLYSEGPIFHYTYFYKCIAALEREMYDSI